MKLSREPAVWVGLIGTVLTVVASLNLDFLNAGQAAAITAGVSALVVALFTRPVAPALFVAAFVAAAAIFAEYGLHLSDAVIGGGTSLILAAFLVFGVRPQVSPSTPGGVIVPGDPVTTATVAR